MQGPEARHLVRVLRAQKGQYLELVDGCCRLVEAGVSWVKSGEVGLQVLRVLYLQDDRLPLEVIIGVLKGEKMDLVVQKVSEIGARALWPVTTEHTVPRLSKDQCSRKMRRWQEVARQALKQCKGIAVTEIRPITELKKAVSERDAPGLNIVLDHSSRAKNLLDVLEKHKDLGSRSNPTLRLLVGPEGGLSSKELAMCLSQGFVPASLGERILRAETATIGAVMTAALFLSPKTRGT